MENRKVYEFICVHQAHRKGFVFKKYSKNALLRKLNTKTELVATKVGRYIRSVFIFRSGTFNEQLQILFCNSEINEQCL